MSALRLNQAASARQARPGTSGRKTSFLQPPEPFSRPLSNRQLKRSQDISVLQDTQGLTEAMSGQRAAETRLGTCYHLLADRNVRAPFGSGSIGSSSKARNLRTVDLEGLYLVSN